MNYSIEIYESILGQKLQHELYTGMVYLITLCTDAIEAIPAAEIHAPDLSIGQVLVRIRSDITTVMYSGAYTSVYACWIGLGKIYPYHAVMCLAAKFARWGTPTSRQALCHVMGRICKRAEQVEASVPAADPLPEAMLAMMRKTRHPLVMLRWRQIRRHLVYDLNEKRAKLQAKVDMWLIKNGLEHWIDAKRKTLSLPPAKRARR